MSVNASLSEDVASTSFSRSPSIPMDNPILNIPRYSANALYAESILSDVPSINAGKYTTG